MSAPALVLHPELRRPIRAEDWDGLSTGTYTRVAQAIAGASPDRAELARYFRTEARIIYDIYTQWRAAARQCLLDKGVDAAALATDEARIHALSVGGRPPIIADRDAAWRAVDDACEGAATLADPAGARAALDEMQRLWRHLHDSDVDHLSGLFDAVITRFGEAALGEMYEKWVIGDWFAKRYKRFDVTHFPWAEAFPLIVYLTFESMHGHLAGPGRLGDVTFESFEDRVTFTFAPCGSGGRAVIGEPLDGTPPHMAPPYRWKALEERHDFAWNLKGVCTYCAHCCILTEKLPIESYGYPVRVVDPPLWPNDGHAVCKWTVYRTPEAVPEAVYARLGFRKPAPGETLGSAGFATRRMKP